MKQNRYANLALSDNGFLFDTVTGHTYTLNRTGTFILKALAAGQDAGEVARALTERFEVTAEAASRDIEDFVQRMADLGIAKRE